MEEQVHPLRTLLRTSMNVWATVRRIGRNTKGGNFLEGRDKRVRNYVLDISIATPKEIAKLRIE